MNNSRRGFLKNLGIFGGLAGAAGAVEEDPLVVLDGLGHVASGLGPDEGGIGLGYEGVLDAVAGGHRAAGHLQAVLFGGSEI